MVHYEKSVQRFEHLVKDSTEVQEMNHVEMFIGSGRRSNHDFRYKCHILNDHSHILVFWMQSLLLCWLRKEGHWTTKIWEALQLYRPKDQTVVNACNSEVVQIRYHTIYPSASARMRDISKSVGCDPPADRASF